MSDESMAVSSQSEPPGPEEREPGSTRSSAQDLGDITAHRLPDGLQQLQQTVGYDGDTVDYYRFELREAREVRMALEPRSGEVELYLEDSAGNVLSRSMAFQSYELVVRTLLAGTYYLRVLPVGTGGSEYEFKYGVLAADAAWRPWGNEPGLAARLGTPSFAEPSYAFALSENTDGSGVRVSLGAVSAVDPNGEALHYSLAGGNESGRFAIDETSGEVFYVGSGEDYESGVGAYELTVRASDGTHTVDATVTVTVTDTPEAPVFGASSYAFELVENTDGGETRIALGTVRAVDPEGDTVRYALVGGNDSGLFAIDEASGELFYVGPGEDYESGAGPYELTVRASDGTHTVDATVTVTVTVTDAPEAPEFSETSYAFELAENTDGSEARIALGTVQAVDPDGRDTLRYALVGGNDSGLFAIDAASGELFYVGPGEDYESVTGPYELTVRASDGAQTVDAPVTVAVTDVRGDSEAPDGDLPADRTTDAVVRVDEGPMRSDIESTRDVDWFAVDLVGGRTYQFDQRGRSSGDGTLLDPFLLGLFDSVGAYIQGTTAPDGGIRYDSRLEFTAPRDGRYYIAAAGNGYEESGTGTYELEVRTVPVPVFGASSYAFELAENADGSDARVSLGAVQAVDPDGGTLRYRLVGGNVSGLFSIDASSGEIYYVGTGEDFESEVASHRLTVRASDGTYTADATVTVTVTDAPEAPAFTQSSYAFELAENTDGGETRIALGTVQAADPDGDTLRYTLVGGNDSGLFAIDEASGEIFYVGSGEDFESGAGPYELTVRASDGTHTVDNIVTVTVADEAEAPAFEESRYGLVLPDEVDGSTNRVLLGRVQATDPDGDSVSYSLVGGNESGLFGIDEASGEVFYVGSQSDLQGGAGSFELTVRASDGTHTVDAVAIVTVIESDSGSEKPPTRQGESEPTEEDLPTERSTRGEVLVDAEPVQGALLSQSDRDWFAVTLAAGRTYVFSLESEVPNGGTTPVIRGLRDSNGNVVPGIQDGTEVRYSTDADASEAVYYVEIGGEGNFDQTAKASHGLVALSAGLEPRSGNIYVVCNYWLWANDITETTDVEDDYPAGRDTTATVAVGSSANGEIERSGDRDWFAVTLEAGKSYRIELEGRSTSAGTLWDPYIRGVHDTNGNLVAGTTDDDKGVGWNSRLHFDPDATATYYIAAGAYGGHTGTYRMSVWEVNDDDFPADTDTTATVAAGSPATGVIERPGERDWFAVTLEAGTRYRIDLEGRFTSAGTLSDPHLEGIHDENGNPIPGTTNDNGGLGYNSRLYFRPEASGIHYIAAGASRNHTGTYRLSVTEVGDDDHPAGTDTTATVAVGGMAVGDIEQPGDEDWFAVTLEAGKFYRIDLKGASTTSGTLQNPYLRGVHDASGEPIPGANDDNGGFIGNSRLYFHADTTGIHYIAAGAARGYTGTYRVFVSEIMDDYPAGTGTTATVAVGGAATGKIHYPGDYDWFAVTLDAGKSYHIDLEGWNTSAGSLWNPYIHRIYDANGNPIPGTTNDDGGHFFNSRLLFEPETTGTYYVAAGSRPMRSITGVDLTGTYRLSVREMIDDHPAGTDTSATVAVGGTTTGDIERPYDRDWFAVTLEAGKSYRIDLEGSDTSAGTLRDPYLRGIHDADGNRISGTSNNDGGVGDNSRTRFEPDATGTYYIAAGAYLDGTGTYELSVEEVL